MPKILFIHRKGKSIVLKRDKKISYEKRKSLYGILFVSPWIIGFILFFLKPFVQSLAFSFSDVTTDMGGFKLSFTGLSNYKFVLFESAKYVDNVVESFADFVSQVPIIFILSLIIAVVLNGKFAGRTFFRSLFFIPAIISTGVVMSYISGDAVMEGMRSTNAAEGSAYATGLIDFNAVFNGLGLPTSFGNIILEYINDIFNLIWNCGVQIVLFVSGLQSIPEQLYEVSKVEGASKWEEFWYITVPMLRFSMILVLVFTAIEFCASDTNKAMSQAYTLLVEQQIYDESATMMWLFFLVIGAVFGGVMFLLQHYVFRKWD